MANALSLKENFQRRNSWYQVEADTMDMRNYRADFNSLAHFLLQHIVDDVAGSSMSAQALNHMVR